MEQNNSTVGDNVNEPAFTIVENLQDNASSNSVAIVMSDRIDYLFSSTFSSQTLIKIFKPH